MCDGITKTNPKMTVWVMSSTRSVFVTPGTKGQRRPAGVEQQTHNSSMSICMSNQSVLWDFSSSCCSASNTLNVDSLKLHICLGVLLTRGEKPDLSYPDEFSQNGFELWRPKN